MLILVVVTIRLSTQGNLFKYARNAVEKTNEAVEYEKGLAGGIIGNKTIEELVNGTEQRSKNKI